MTLSRTLTAALVAAAATAPAATAQPIDTNAALDVQPAQDLRPPDARQAALAQERYYDSYGVKPDDSTQDLRSPDARDAAAGRGTWNAPRVTVVRIPQNAPSSGGIDWADVGIGAGGVLGLTLLALGGGLTVVHRRHAARQTATIA
jgi:hypothetical protein